MSAPLNPSDLQVCTVTEGTTTWVEVRDRSTSAVLFRVWNGEQARWLNERITDALPEEERSEECKVCTSRLHKTSEHEGSQR